MKHLTPMQAWWAKTLQHGLRVVPFDADLLYEFMELEYRVVSRGGVTVNNRRYDSPRLDPIRGHRCRLTGTRQWPVRVDRNDLRFIHVNVKAGTGEPAVWVRVPWVDMPHELAFPLPERILPFLRTHMAVKRFAGDDIEWQACEDVADRHRSQEEVSMALGNTLGDFLEWISAYKQRLAMGPSERSAADEALAGVVEAARRTVRWQAKQARATNARVLAELAASDADEPEMEAVEDEFAPPPSQEPAWDPEQVPLFH